MFFGRQKRRLARITEPSNDDSDNDESDNCDFGLNFSLIGSTGGYRCPCGRRLTPGSYDKCSDC